MRQKMLSILINTEKQVLISMLLQNILSPNIDIMSIVE